MPRRRTSNQMKVLKGTDRKDRMREEPFTELGHVPDAPDWLISPIAVEEFQARAADLVEAGVMTEASVTQLAHYCNLHAAMVKKWRAGMEPTAAEVTQLRLMGTEFGFTPASRSKAGGSAKKKDENPFGQFKAGAG